MLNSVNLVGRLTADPDTRTVGDDKTVTTFRIAVDRIHGDGDSTDYVPISCWNSVATSTGRYLRKGRLVAVSGALRHREWTDDDGTKHYRLGVVANSVDFLDRPKD